jgi:hypothetical protein
MTGRAIGWTLFLAAVPEAGASRVQGASESGGVTATRLSRDACNNLQSVPARVPATGRKRYRGGRADPEESGSTVSGRHSLAPPEPKATGSNPVGQAITFPTLPSASPLAPLRRDSAPKT